MFLRNTVLIGALAATASANAFISFTGSPIFENFDSLATSGSTAMTATIGLVQPVPGPTGFDAAKIAGTGTTAYNFVANDGIANSGALYSYGTGTNAERALGALASGSNALAFGTEIVNNSGLAITSVTISFVREQWRSSTTTQNVLPFFYAVSGGTANATNYLNDAGVIANTNLDVVGQAPVVTNGAQDGNANQLATSNSFAVAIAPGQSLFIRWQDFNDVGNDAGLAIDDFRFEATVVPEPSTILALGAALVLLAARRRK